MTSVWADREDPCPRCGSIERRDYAEFDFEPDGMCWSEHRCEGCGLIGGTPHIGWSETGGPLAEPWENPAR